MTRDFLDNYLAGRELAMFRLLEQLVLIQSSTHNKKGVDRVGQQICRALQDLPLACERIEESTLGDHLIFTTPAARNSEKSILIAGHMDTVFPENTEFNWYREDVDKAYGPGVIDMKGGLVVTIFAVHALAAAGLLEQMPITLLFNSDEEMGSPTSIPLIKKLAKKTCCALVTECGGMQGEVVTGRRGKLGLRVDVHGQAGHAAFAGSSKASAVLELARKTILFEECHNPEKGVVVNVGKVEGGIGANSIAEHAMALIDTRYCRVEDGEQLLDQLQEIVRESETPGTRCELGITNERPVMEQSEQNRSLFNLLKKQADLLGIKVKDEMRQGVSDANTLAGVGVPVLDGLGPIGEFDHSDREYMVKASLLEKTRLLAALLPAIVDGFTGSPIKRPLVKAYRSP